MSVDVYAVGLCYASVCCPEDMAIDDLLEAVNRSHPTGINSRWAVSLDKTFASGKPNPSPCELHNGRVHRLLYC